MRAAQYNYEILVDIEPNQVYQAPQYFGKV